MLMRLRRLANGEERRGKATKEQLKENSEIIFRIRADENEGEIQDVDSKTKEYDSQTAGKTLWRLAKATRNLKGAINKILPSKERKVKYIARKNGSYEKQESIDDDIDECERMTSISGINTTFPMLSTSCNDLMKFMREVRDKARKATFGLRRRRREETEAMINGKGQTAIYEMYKYLRGGYEPPSAAIKDPCSKELIFDHRRQHELMIREWKTVYDQHKQYPPSWDAYQKKYGNFKKDIDAPDNLPTAKQLF
jgi:hypothetical protein